VIASREAPVTAWSELSIDGSKFLDLILRMDFSSGIRFIMDKFAVHKSSIEWDGVRLDMHRAVYSLCVSARRRPEL